MVAYRSHFFLESSISRINTYVMRSKTFTQIQWCL